MLFYCIFIYFISTQT